jgi:hypothetical protein
MKYIQTYEEKLTSKDFRYKNGDHIVFMEDTYNRELIPVKILSLDIADSSKSYQFYNVIGNTGIEYCIGEDVIIKKMTKDEIEDFESKLNSKKYNL